MSVTIRPTFGRVGKLKTKVGKQNIFSALGAEFYETNVFPTWPETLPAPLNHAIVTVQRS